VDIELVKFSNKFDVEKLTKTAFLILKNNITLHNCCQIIGELGNTSKY